MEIAYIFHLNHKQHIRPVSSPTQLGQPLQMFHTTGCGSVGEGAHAICFQGYTLYFQEALNAIFAECKVKAGIPLEHFCLEVLDFSKATGCKPLLCG